VFPAHVAVLPFLLHVNVALRFDGCWAGAKLTTRYSGITCVSNEFH
jgi:hypothetical protein